MLDLLKFSITAEDRTKRVLNGIKGELKGIKGSLKSVDEFAKKAGRSMRNIGAGLSLGVTAPLALLGKQSVKLYDDQLKAQAAVEQVIKSTSKAAGLGADDLFKMASGLQAITTFGDETILRDVTAPLLTFTKISGDVFERSQAAVLDMATLLKMDLRSASIQVGKALNDPILGVTALGRAGVQFSDDQKDVIKSLVKTGDVAKAQGLILSELETQFKGQAAAAAATPLGRWEQLSNAIGDIKEQLGGQVVPFLVPVADKVSDAITWFSNLDDGIKRSIVIFGGFAAAAGPVLITLGLITSGVGLLAGGLTTLSALIFANPIGLLLVGSLAVAGGIAFVVTKLGGFANALNLVKALGLEVWGKIADGAHVLAIQADIAATQLTQHFRQAFAYVVRGFADMTSTIAAGWNQLFGTNITGLGVGYAEKLEELIETTKGTIEAQSNLATAKWDLASAPLEAVKKIREEWTKSGEAIPEALKAIQDAAALAVPETLGNGSGLKEIEDGIASSTQKFSGFTDEVKAANAAVKGLDAGARKIKEIEPPAWYQDFKTNLKDLIKGSKDFGEAFRGVMASAADRLLDFALDQAWGTLFKNQARAGSGTGGSGGAGIIGSIVDALFFAKGGVFQSGQVKPFASGGVVSSPTMFPMSGGGAGVMGERGAEAIMPLTRIGGSLGVRAVSDGSRGGGGVTFVNTFAIDARGSQDPAATEAAAKRALDTAVPIMERRAGEMVLDMRRRGII